MDSVGYHGTSKENALKIVKSQIIEPSTGLDEWLGKGRYFFVCEDDARWWCKTRRFSIPAVIIARFNFRNKVLDLVSSREDQEGFKRFCDIVKNKSARLPNGKRRRNYMQLAMEELLKHAKSQGTCIDAAKALFSENRDFWYTKNNDISKFPCLIGQIQICVYNDNAIVCLKLSEEGQYGCEILG